jgi:hypothetical protein
MSNTISKTDIEVAEMAGSEGWKALSAYMSQVVKTNTSRLTNEEFASLQEVALLQGEIRGMNEILQFVNTRLAKVRKEED